MPNAATTNQTFDPTSGLLTSSTSVHGAVTTYAYVFNPTVVTATTNSHWTKSHRDGFGREISTESGYGSTVVSRTDTIYGPCACSPLARSHRCPSLTASIVRGRSPPDGTGTIAWTTYSYDSLLVAQRQ